MTRGGNMAVEWHGKGTRRKWGGNKETEKGRGRHGNKTKRVDHRNTKESNLTRKGFVAWRLSVRKANDTEVLRYDTELW